MEIGTKVKAVSGEYTGYYGEVISIAGGYATVSHSTEGDVLNILISDLEITD